MRRLRPSSPKSEPRNDSPLHDRTIRLCDEYMAVSHARSGPICRAEQRRPELKAISPVGEFLFFACPKKRNQKKRHPNFRLTLARLGRPGVHRNSTWQATHFVTCCGIQTADGRNPLARLRCSARQMGPNPHATAAWHARRRLIHTTIYPKNKQPLNTAANPTPPGPTHILLTHVLES